MLYELASVPHCILRLELGIAEAHDMPTLPGIEGLDLPVGLFDAGPVSMTCHAYHLPSGEIDLHKGCIEALNSIQAARAAFCAAQVAARALFVVLWPAVRAGVYLVKRLPPAVGAVFVDQVPGLRFGLSIRHASPPGQVFSQAGIAWTSKNNVDNGWLTAFAVYTGPAYVDIDRWPVPVDLHQQEVYGAMPACVWAHILPIGGLKPEHEPLVRIGLLGTACREYHRLCSFLADWGAQYPPVRNRV